jgi:hypothetical protein
MLLHKGKDVERATTRTLNCVGIIVRVAKTYVEALTLWTYRMALMIIGECHNSLAPTNRTGIVSVDVRENIWLALIIFFFTHFEFSFA